MDSWTPKSSEEVEAGLQTIKAHMPKTYARIQELAAQDGGLTFKLVRRGLRGEPNVFWASEAGYVMGTAYSYELIRADVALCITQLGSSHWVIVGCPSGEVMAQRAKESCYGLSN